jgi:glycosyltransferase involved in cell wall biosynthesis
MSDVKVSVCMVTYNQDRYIAQAVESALMQETNFPFEIVIGEDCSTDSTRAIVEELAIGRPDVIRLRLAEKNQGAKRNFVGTFADCRGQYVTILEGDDYYTSPHKLQLQADALDAHPDWAICFHPARCLYEDGLHGPEKYPADWQKPEATIHDLLAANFMATAGVMFRNRLWEMPDWFLQSDLGDWPLHILNAAHGNVGFLRDVMSVYRIHAKGVWSGRNLTANLTSVFRMLTAVDRHFNGKYAESIEEFRLNTVRWLIRERDDVRLMNDGDVDALQRTCDRLAEENRSLPGLQSRCAELTREVDALLPYRDKCAQLHQENARLREFRDDWSNTLGFKATRETRRFAGQIRSATQKLLGRTADVDPASDSSNDPDSRAA